MHKSILPVFARLCVRMKGCRLRLCGALRTNMFSTQSSTNVRCGTIGHIRIQSACAAAAAVPERESHNIDTHQHTYTRLATTAAASIKEKRDAATRTLILRHYFRCASPGRQTMGTLINLMGNARTNSGALLCLWRMGGEGFRRCVAVKRFLIWVKRPRRAHTFASGRLSLPPESMARAVKMFDEANEIENHARILCTLIENINNIYTFIHSY